MRHKGQTRDKLSQAQSQPRTGSLTLKVSEIQLTVDVRYYTPTVQTTLNHSILVSCVSIGKP